jgi:chitin disaccharide deacetylase
MKAMLRRNFLAALAAAPAAAASQTSAAAAASADTATAAKLGRGDAKLLMVHADDAGMCHSVNLATAEALSKGIIASASVMMPCPWVREFADWARQHPDADLGLHLTLTSEWKYYRWPPLATKDSVKGLLDDDGCMWADVRSVATHATAKEVETELRAQIERARKLGIRFTHLDTHMGTLYARPDYFDVYTRLAREAGVPCMMPRPTAAAAAELHEYPITADMLNRKEAEGFVMLDRLVTGVPGRTFEERRDSYRKFLRDLKPGVTKLIIHLSKDDAEIRTVTGSWQQRYADFQFFTSDEARDLMASLGIGKVTYRELGRLSAFPH